MSILKELLHINTDLPNEQERINELENEDCVKREILNGKGNKYLTRKYDVSVAFVVKCRKELRNEGA